MSIGVALTSTLVPSGVQVQASGTVPLQNYFTVDSGGDQGKKMPLYDGTIEKYNGFYYVAGTGTTGNLYKSKDMVHWEGPTRFISTDPATLPPFAPNDITFPRYGASDFLFHNGVMFYGFNSSNLIHGNPATMSTDHPDFRHSFWDKQYDRGIDLQFFIAPNGDQLYLRKLNPGESDPNVGGAALGRPGVWLWNVKSFFNELGNPDRGLGKELLFTSPGYWSNLNHFNFEGPELYYRNGQYYLLYASNQMDPRSGLYDTGIAQSDDYNTFNNSKNLPNKLLGRNIERLLLKYTPILPTAEFGSQTYTFTYDKPGDGWQNIDFDTASWKTGNGGFGYPIYTVAPARVPSIYTTWGSSDTPENLWTRRTFTLTSVPDTVVLRHRLEGYGKLYINGQEVVSQQGIQPGYAMVEVPKGILKTGTNVIAATMSRTGPQVLADYHLDFGLYDTKGEPVEADIVGPSQPNIIEGPNGFETWITYKAFWDGVNGQGKDRVYFWGDEMVVDGPTSSTSSGVHFDASAPSFEDRFNNESSLKNYMHVPADTRIHEGVLSINSRQGQKQMLLKEGALSNYYLESNIRFDDSKGLAGVTVWYRNDANQIQLQIDRERRKYVITTILNAQASTQEAELPYTYQFLHEDPRAADFGEQFHTLKVYKNGSKLFAELDHYKLNNDLPVMENALLNKPGKVGLVCQNSVCSIDNVSLTSGWSESGNQINNWISPWTLTGQGLTSSAAGPSLNVKGDALSEYEFSANVSTDTLPATGKAGIIVEYIDENNYVAAFTNFETRQFELYKVVNGQSELIQSASTARDTIYGHNNYDPANYNLNCGGTATPACDIGQREYMYKLRAPAEVSRANILWTAGEFKYLKTTFLLPNVTSSNFGFDSWNKDTGAWSPAGFTYDGNGKKGIYQTAKFNSNLTTDQIRLKVPAKINRPFAFSVHEEISAQNFYRTVRKDGQLYVWVNNQLIFKQADPFAGSPAKAGLYSNDLAARFNSITTFEMNPPRLEVFAPKADLANGELVSGTSVTLSTYTEGARIYYSMDGSAPSPSSQKYKGPISITKPVTLRAIAVKGGMNESEELVQNYSVLVPSAP
ncbi:chitobiase/beta-hexosaminidase C-terminal domain-containing protein [Paenibacillus sp. V4I7]|uniref:chitobiase/beta-hexosaminidase C-terminal domain-containing protein n=1 Tax=Paenibacillus sp. V4I7 TaxID=3042307 RepID=UPI0027D8150D|nr:chitobiase/beta-hexosaminidase C-terminal domain-containing protein [Paenibacillus sp. V4I7]